MFGEDLIRNKMNECIGFEFILTNVSGGDEFFLVPSMKSEYLSDSKNNFITIQKQMEHTKLKIG